MLTIEEYVKPRSVAEASELLATRKNAVVVGGGVFMRLASRRIGLAIDLSGAGLDFIRETGGLIEIGAMTTFGALERSPLLKERLDGLIPRAVAHIPGQQLRNMVTVGGTVYGRYGFSELLTCLMALDCTVVGHQAGAIKLADFLARAGKTGDIIESIRIKLEPGRAGFQTFRNSAGSLPILSAAVSCVAGHYRIAVGGRPGVAALATEAMLYLESAGTGAEAAVRAAELALEQLSFGNDRRASAAYRRELCGVLVKRALAEVWT